MKALWVLMLSVAVCVPFSGHAEIYKWKDSNGVTRYSDTPPPSNVRQLPMSGGKPVKSAQDSENDVAGQSAGEQNKPAKQAVKESGPVQKGSEEEAIKRQEAAEAEKRRVQQKAAEEKARQENCLNAQKQLQTYTLGGRIYEVDEKGERIYKGDKDIAKGLEEARQDVEKYCE